jgi:hypothetical protein
VLWKCVEFTQDAISGLALLELAGMNSGQPPQVYDWGGGAYTVCQVDHEPVSVPDRCFGPTSGPNWADWSMAGGGWHARASGAGGYSVRDGDVEGWTYTTGFGSPPPGVLFSQVCPAAVSSPRPTQRGTAATVSPRATPTAAAVAPPTPSPPASLDALAPTPTPTTKAALAVTNASADGPPPPSSAAAWLLLLFGTTVLVGLAAVNLLRRGP